MTFLRIGLVLALAVAAAIVANIVLLRIASGAHEPVGNLRPATFADTTPTKPTVPATPTPTLPDHDETEPDDD
jgi:hypothetical protein